MHWLSVLLIGIASNLDNLGISVTLGMRATHIPFSSNLIIAVLSMLATYLSLAMGSFVSGFVSPAVANFTGGLLIISLGAWTIWSSFQTPSDGSIFQDPSTADRDRNHVISWKESITLGLALALNSLAGGFGAGISGVPALWTTLSVGLFSLLTVDLGARAGTKIAATWLGRHADFVSGLLLIAIGFYEIVI